MRNRGPFSSSSKIQHRGTDRGTVPNSHTRSDPKSLCYIEQIMHLSFRACGYMFIAKKVDLSSFKEATEFVASNMAVFWHFYTCILGNLFKPTIFTSFWPPLRSPPENKYTHSPKNGFYSNKEPLSPAKRQVPSKLRKALLPPCGQTA